MTKRIMLYTMMILLNLAAAAIIGMVLLDITFSLPLSPIEKNVRQSAVTIRNEGTYPKVTKYATSQLDNFTDSIMMLEAADASEVSTIEKTVFVYHGVIDGLDRAEGLAAHFIDGKDFTREYDYSRYWHGYLIILRPMLSLFGYSTIRIINGIVQLLVICVISVLMYRCGLKNVIVPYVISYMMLMPIAMSKSMQFSVCFYVLSLGVILLLATCKHCNSNHKDTKAGRSDTKRSECAYRSTDTERRYELCALFIFLNMGILTAYFDLLTYPIATFGVPAVIYLLLTETEELMPRFIRLARNGILWCVGYGCMWISKWILGSLLTGINLFDNATNVFKQRTAAESADGLERFGIYTVLRSNYGTFLKTPVTLIMILYFIYVVIRVIASIRSRRVTFGDTVRHAIPYVILALVPAVWYIFARNHSAIHYWFTNKACIVTALAGMCGLLYAANADVKMDVKMEANDGRSNKNVRHNNNETGDL
ncbi:MAG: hypothetical protein J6O17_04190 [Eubacterium sp.]|nr:hypothetical protein [Eubacterium sp.]